MSRQGLAQALDKLQMGPGQAAALWAVFSVETAGTTQCFGFRADRRPQILFERHKFRQYTDGQFDATAPDVSGPQAAYGSLASQYPKLEKAIQLCTDVGLGVEPALKSASWGIGQVMGFNHVSAGHASALEMVKVMVQSEDAQLQAMVGFLTHNGAAAALKSQNWAKFARIYNGANYAQNQYDIKLEQEYARFSTGSMPDLEVRTAQAALLLLGYSIGRIDGVVGRRTRDGLRGFQLASELPVTSELDSATFSALWSRAFS